MADQLAIDFGDAPLSGRVRRCVFCGAPADLLCDAVFGWPPEECWTREEPTIAGQRGRPVKRVVYRWRDEDGEIIEPFTCDLELCEGCSTKGSPIFMCGSGPDLPCVIVEDFCPFHRGGAWRIHSRPLTADEADDRRRELRRQASELLSEGKRDG